MPGLPPGYDELRVLLRWESVPVGYVKLKAGEQGKWQDKTELRRQFAPAKIEVEGQSRAQPSLTEEIGSDGVDGVFVTVAVCTRDRAEQLQGTLEALARQTYRNFEVLVVDNAPSDEKTRELVQPTGQPFGPSSTHRATLRAEFNPPGNPSGRVQSSGEESSIPSSSLRPHPSVLPHPSSALPSSSLLRYVVEEKPGLDWARNRAIAEAQGEIIAYTDDDARPDADWVAEVARAFSDPAVDAMTGLVVPAELETPAQVTFEDLYGGFGKGFERKLYHISRPTRRAFPYAAGMFGAGCNMAFRREVFEKIGGFDVALDVGTPTGGGGDMDIFIRVLRDGFTLLYEPRAVVRHLHRRDMAALERQMGGYARSFFAYLSKWAWLDKYRAFDILGYAMQGWLLWMVAKALLSLLGLNGVPRRVALTQLWNAPLGPLAYWRGRKKF